MSYFHSLKMHKIVITFLPYLTNNIIQEIYLPTFLNCLSNNYIHLQNQQLSLSKKKSLFQLDAGLDFIITLSKLEQSISYPNLS